MEVSVAQSEHIPNSGIWNEFSLSSNFMLKPQDIVVLLKLAGQQPGWTFERIAAESHQPLGSSPQPRSRSTGGTLRLAPQSDQTSRAARVPGPRSQVCLPADQAGGS